VSKDFFRRSLLSQGKSVTNLIFFCMAVEEMRESTPLMKKALDNDIPVVRMEFISTLTPKSDLVAHMKENLLSGYTVLDSIPGRLEKVKLASQTKEEKSQSRSTRK